MVFKSVDVEVGETKQESDTPVEDYNHVYFGLAEDSVVLEWEDDGDVVVD